MLLHSFYFAPTGRPRNHWDLLALQSAHPLALSCSPLHALSHSGCLAPTCSHSHWCSLSAHSRSLAHACVHIPSLLKLRSRTQILALLKSCARSRTQVVLLPLARIHICARSCIHACVHIPSLLKSRTRTRSTALTFACKPHIIALHCRLIAY